MTAENEHWELHRQFDVLVCTGLLTFTGTLSCDFSQRLIDALNEGTRSETKAKLVGFLPLENVTMSRLRGGEKKFPHIYIAKNNIVFVAQVSDPWAEKQLRAYPFKEKTAMRVMAHAAGDSDVQFSLDGRIYVDVGGQLVDTIESEVRFLPMTQVQVDPGPPGSVSKYDFVALNKQHIISICESPVQQ